MIKILIFNCLSLNFSMLLFWSYLTPKTNTDAVADPGCFRRGAPTPDFRAKTSSLRRLCFHTCLSVNRRCVWQTPPRGRHPPGRHPPGQTPPWGRLIPGQTPPGQTPPVHAEIWSTSGWYASHWNAFFFGMIFAKNCIKTRMRSSRMRTTCSSSHCGDWQVPPQLPPGCWSGPDPLNFPFGCGPGSDPPQFSPWLWAWRPPDTPRSGTPWNQAPSDQPPHWGQPPHWDQAPPMHQAPLGPGTPSPPRTRHPPGPGTSPVDRILDTCFWKYYLTQNFVCGQ